MTNIPNDPETLDSLADAVMSRGGEVVIIDMLNDWRYGATGPWDIVREILRMAAEEGSGGVQSPGRRGITR